MNLALWLQRSALRYATRPALLRGAEPVADYAAFWRQASCLAAALQARGVGTGDRVAIFAKNCPEFLIAFYGIWAAGAVAVPINAKLHAKEAAWIIGNSGASLGLCSSALAGVLASAAEVPIVDMESAEFQAMCQGEGLAPVERAEDDLCWLFYTSGTTGRPKGVRITHGMVRAASLAYPVDVDEVSPEDAALYAAPMSHGAGLYAAIHVLRGAAHLVPASGAFDPAEVLELAAGQGQASMFLAPTMVRRLLDAAKAAGDKGSGIKTIVYGGGPMYVSDITEALDWFGPKFVQIYGQGECPMCITALSREEVAGRVQLGSVGRAQSVVELAIKGGAETGEIMVRGAPVMQGYWENPEATEKALQNGWLMTGDVGRLDAEGYLTLVDRSKDLIISGGTNIYPREVEEVLLQHPDIQEVSVIGRPSAEWGEDVVAFVVGRADAAALNAFCLDNMARFKRPKDYVFVPELPKNNYGKVLKTELRKRLS
ncbi:Long-chain-fatty-acid--CoA ligase [Candidatus Rhodobacter oscarellae]|uniref:3-methylmercaptopropionyl-CoA ligase n=1 Tax=Candidatus Rhodobacter oscarellae TaxID=1675527 RepID=A0A0J9E8Y2_9RHOB|nr:AMP-binding protein [Candidatus Rhodobacter lobularis]KMW58114.1 Long-chain-fatty-acid--CoA ligase [Candidatus Rhodobacter lobularis]